MGALLWRLSALCAGVPVGWLAAWVALGPEPSWTRLLGGATAGAVAMLLATSLVVLARDPDPARGAHAAAAASAGWLALPAWAACWAGLAPGPGWLLVATGLAVALALLWSLVTRAPAPSARTQLVRVVFFTCGGALALVLAGGWLAGRAPAGPRFSDERAHAAFDADARIATRPLPRCARTPRRVEVLVERGAHPRLAADGALLWFDAPDEDGVRQIERIELRSRRALCLTCDEEGPNRRPAPGFEGGIVVFQTGRHRSPWDPTNSELHAMAGGGERSLEASRRLTASPGPDERPLRGPDGELAWSRRRGGHFQVVAARLAHVGGELALGEPSLLAEGGAAWIAPLAWSPDARQLVVGSGNPFGRVTLERDDHGARARAPLAPGLDAREVAFSADGGWLALASGAGRSGLGWLPTRAGFLLGALADRAALYGPGRSGVASGPPDGPFAALDLGDAAEWGAPTGVALAPDASWLVLGQRRAGGGPAQERLLRIELACRAGGAAPL